MRKRRPLQNRVAPNGEIHSVVERGDFMGNRGGRIHDLQTQTLNGKNWASKRWICCVTKFKERKRAVMGSGYTELFFLDEVTALSAGHRPCFECRRTSALAFQTAFGKSHGLSQAPKADEMDTILHRERIEGRIQKRHEAPLQHLPSGAMFVINDEIHALAFGKVLRWRFSGYQETPIIPSRAEVNVLTPPSICRVLSEGYRPIWHKTADQLLETGL